MPITVTMLQTRQGEGGSLWTAGNSYSASDAFGALLIASNLATGTLPAVAPSNLTQAEVAATQALANANGTLPSQATRTLMPCGIDKTVSSTLSQTWAVKASIPADATQVGLIAFHSAPGFALTGVRSCVAATESFYPHSASADRFHPFVAGTDRRVLDDTATIYGWRSMTWSGANSPTLPNPGAENTPTYAASDLVALPDLPPSATDIAAGVALGYPAAELAKFRYVIFRVFVPGAVGNEYAFAPFNDNSVYSAATNKGFVRRHSTSSGDIVTTAVNTSTGDSASSSLGWAIVYRSGSNGRNCLFSGDSLVQNNATITNAEPYAPWGARACYAAGAGDGRAWSPINFGCAGVGMAAYYAAVIVAIPALQPHAASLAIASVNDMSGLTTLALAQTYFSITCRQRVMDFIALCNTNRVRPILQTMQPAPASFGIASSALGKTIDNERRAHNAWARSLCGASAAALLFDLDALLTDSGTVDAFGVYRIQAALTPDGTHQNEAGVRLMVPVFASILNSF
jgi:hypothetical protein